MKPKVTHYIKENKSAFSYLKQATEFYLVTPETSFNFGLQYICKNVIRSWFQVTENI